MLPAGEREPLLNSDGKKPDDESAKSVPMSRLFAEAAPEALVGYLRRCIFQHRVVHAQLIQSECIGNTTRIRQHTT